mmetsp:Transcript_8086/g.17525  ORF Transcript_8086/g.17525 Transcript_8086/m.17525 type:complete len:230 (-) Transcript_8086:929-1618(-)
MLLREFAEVGQPNAFSSKSRLPVTQKEVTVLASLLLGSWVIHGALMLKTHIKENLPCASLQSLKPRKSRAPVHRVYSDNQARTTRLPSQLEGFPPGTSGAVCQMGGIARAGAHCCGQCLDSNINRNVPIHTLAGRKGLQHLHSPLVPLSHLSQILPGNCGALAFVECLVRAEKCCRLFSLDGVGPYVIQLRGCNDLQVSNCLENQKRVILCKQVLGLQQCFAHPRVVRS